MKKIYYIAVCFCMVVVQVEARETPSGLDINSPKDALLKISEHNFSNISLEKLISDIKSGVVYKEKVKYPQGYVAVESQNDYGHYGSVDFEFKPPFNFSKAELIAHLGKIEGHKSSINETSASFRWQSNGLKCSVDFEDGESYKFFQYLCHYAGK